MEKWQLKQMQELPLEVKIEKTKQRIKEWYEHWNGEIYVAFSGGKDSTVLLHIVRQMYPDVTAIYVDTGLEYPEINQFVRTFNKLIIVKPRLNFADIIKKYGFPVISKEQAGYIRNYRETKSEEVKKRLINGNKNGNFRISTKYLDLLHSDFKISEQCCTILKKNPIIEIEKRYGLHPIVGTMASESMLRLQHYLKNGCNSFGKNPKSTPISFWTEKDIWDYIKKYNVPYSKIYDMGYKRTGCVFCGFGCTLEKEPNKFQLMKQTHPELYNYCINKLEIGKIFDFLKVPY